MHTQSGASCTILSLHHFVTSELDPVDQGIQVRGREGRWKRVRRLGQKGHNGDTAMATNNGNNNACGVRFGELPNECRRTDNVKSCYTKESKGRAVSTGESQGQNDWGCIR